MKLSKIKTIILAVALLLPYTLFGVTLTGTGFGKTKSDAKKEALADLSQYIKSEVRSDVQSMTYVKGSDALSSSSSNIKISSNLPMLGVEYNYIDKRSEFEAVATIATAEAKPLYTKEMQSLNSEIDSLLGELKKADSSSLKLQLYEDIFSLLNEYGRYKSVTGALDIEVEVQPAVTKAQVKVEIEKLSSQIDSLEMAAGIFSNEFDEDGIFVYPPLLQNATTASQFSSVFLKELKGKVKTTATLKDASYLLVGEYSLMSEAIVLNYELLNAKTNEVEKSKTLTINQSAYKGLELKPANIDFDALLNEGVVSSSSLKVSLNSSKGSQNLLFNDGEDVELFVKLNKMGYIYIVGYTQTEDEKLSYLLELQEGRGDSKFVKFINADDASRWMSLGEFSVEKPFGVESLQVIASNRDITTLPSTYYDENSGYYVVSKDIKKALSQTRGLKKKKSKKAEFSEDVMSFTTMK